MPRSVRENMARILVIEDEPAERTSLCRQLASAGHDVLDTAEAAIALGLVDLFDAEIVISEVMLRKQDGVAGLLTIRQSFPTLPFIVISEGNQQDAGTLLHAGGLRQAVWLLSKPFASAELLKVVEAALAS